jgi:hypothetical protein
MNYLYYQIILGRDSSVGMAASYGLEDPGIESRWKRIFPHPSRRALGPTHFLYNGYRIFFGDKKAGAWRWPPIPSSAEVKEGVELYHYSPSGPSRPVLWQTLPLPLPNNTASETFINKLGRVGLLTGYFSLGCLPGGERWIRHWTKILQSPQLNADPLVNMRTRWAFPSQYRGSYSVL